MKTVDLEPVVCWVSRFQKTTIQSSRELSFSTCPMITIGGFTSHSKTIYQLQTKILQGQGEFNNLHS